MFAPPMPPALARRASSRFALAGATLAALFALAYAVAQVLTVTVWFPPDWIEVAAIMAPSLGIAVFFVPTVAVIHARASPDRKHLTLAALAFASMYAALVGMVYMVQLSLVVPELYAGRPVDAELFRIADKTLMTMADAIGYAFMSVSAGLAAFAFGGDRLGRWTRRALLAHGALAPFVALAASIPAMLAIGALWLVTGPAGLGLVAWGFARELRADGRAAEAVAPVRGGKPSA